MKPHLTKTSIYEYERALMDEAPLHVDVWDLHPGGMQIREGQLLSNLALAWGGPVFEIGVEYGNSSLFIDWGLTFHDAPGQRKLYSCDIQDVRAYKPKTQVFYPYPSRLVFPPARCTWAFIDGDHTKAGVVADIRHCVSALDIRKLVFHDAREGDPTDGTNDQAGTDVLEAALEELGDWKLTLLKSPCGILIAEAPDG
jgi:hypothetical protein